MIYAALILIVIGATLLGYSLGYRKGKQDAYYTELPY